MTNPELADLPVSLLINGQRQKLKVPPWLMLLDLLRERLDLVDGKRDYDHDQCDACAMLRNDRRINACLTLAVVCDGGTLTTIESLAEDDRLRPLQQAFIRHDVFQCGYCTPEQICSALGLTSEGRARLRAGIREGMDGDLCRYGAYGDILDAVEDALSLLDRDGQGRQRV